jgi:hypothetical protein
MVDTAIAVLTVLVLAGRGWHTTAATIPAAVPIS